jgi:hypothetical protein
MDNPDTWLDFTDLVFVDPVGTGYSRTTAGTDEADRAFYSGDKDADAMANFPSSIPRERASVARVPAGGRAAFRCILLADRRCAPE